MPEYLDKVKAEYEKDGYVYKDLPLQGAMPDPRGESPQLWRNGFRLNTFDTQ